MKIDYYMSKLTMSKLTVSKLKWSTHFLSCVLLALIPLSTTYAASLKVGVVNAAKVIEDAPQADAARKKLEQEFAPRDKKLLEIQKKLRSLEGDLERDSAIMSESTRRKLERDIVSLKRDFKRGQDEFREDLNLRRNEEFGKLQKRVSEVIVSIAKEGKYDLILTDGVIYASDNVDITDKVVQRLKLMDKRSNKSKK